MYVAEHHPKEELKELIRREKHAVSRNHLQAILMAKDLKSAKNIGKELGYSESVVKLWVHRYNANGLQGIIVKKPPGRKKPFTEE